MKKVRQIQKSDFHMISDKENSVLKSSTSHHRRKFLRSLGIGIAGLTSFSFRSAGEEESALSSLLEMKPKVYSTDNQKVAIPFVKGRFQHVLNPPGKHSDAKKRRWYINDHCFYVDKKNQIIHWYGITNPIPAAGESMYGPGSSLYMGHATAPSPFGPWTEHPHVFSEPEEDGHIGCPFIVPYEGGYLMLYPNNRMDKKRLFVATSKDLYSWEKIDGFGPIGEGNLRDPCLLKLDDGNYLLYAADFSNQRIPHVRLYKTEDLLNYEELKPALLGSQPVSTPYYLESPFVFRHGGTYYLLINFSHHQYSETVVYASKNPYKFDWEKPLTTIFTHAPEIFEWQGKYYISHCGLEDQHWERPGLYLAELVFKL